MLGIYRHLLTTIDLDGDVILDSPLGLVTGFGVLG